MIEVQIEHSLFYSDLVGTLPDGRVACLELVGKKTLIDRACVQLHKGSAIVADGRIRKTLGEKAFRVYKNTLSHRLSMATILPNESLTLFQTEVTDQPDGDGGDNSEQQETNTENTEDKANSVPPILIWRGQNASDHDERIWAHLRENMPVPLLDHWRTPVMRRLWTLSSEADADVSALSKIQFSPAGDGLWGGIAIQLTTDQLAQVVHDAIMSGEADYPSAEELGLIHNENKEMLYDHA